MSESKLVYCTKARKIDSFTGATSVSIEDWLEEVKIVFRSCNITSDAEQADYVLSHLDGQAKTEVKFHSPKEKGSFLSLECILRKAFGENRSFAQLQQAFYSRRQREDEELRDFSYALLELANKIQNASGDPKFDTSGMLLHNFAEGVCDPDLRRELKSKLRNEKETDFLNFRDWAIQWTADGDGRGKDAQLRMLLQLQEKQQAEIQQLTKQIQGLKISGQQQRQGQRGQYEQPHRSQGAQGNATQPAQGGGFRGHCNGCGEFGHRKRDCPHSVNQQSRRCSFCNAPDHFWRNCPLRMSQLQGSNVQQQQQQGN